MSAVVATTTQLTGYGLVLVPIDYANQVIRLREQANLAVSILGLIVSRELISFFRRGGSTRSTSDKVAIYQIVPNSQYCPLDWLAVCHICDWVMQDLTALPSRVCGGEENVYLVF